MKIINTNELFGDRGPFDADSFEALADEMMPTITDWAQEELSKFDDMVEHYEADDVDRPQLHDIIQQMRDDFIDGLEEISD